MIKQTLASLIIGATLLLTSCTTNNNCSQILEIKEHQSNSIRLIYETNTHKTLGTIVKESNSFTCQDTTIYTDDWLQGNVPYGPFDEEAYQDYKSSP